MEIKLNVLNYSKGMSDDSIKVYIENLFKELLNNGVNIDNVQIEYNNADHYKMVKKFIDENPRDKPLIKNPKLFSAICEYYPKCERFIIIGENLPTQNKWGDAITDLFTVIKNISEKNIWHEVAHIIGAEDHYDCDTQKAINNCMSDNCIMQFGKANGIFCECSINEIKGYLKKLE